MSPDKRTLEALKKVRALERKIGRYGAVLDQDELLNDVVEIRLLLEPKEAR